MSDDIVDSAATAFLRNSVILDGLSSFDTSKRVESYWLLGGSHHDKGVEFLETFATCNPLDDNHAGPIKVVEKVVVSEMEKAGFIFYKDTKLHLRVYGVDVYRTARDSQTLVNNSVSKEQWGRGLEDI
ncbi:hypothetical protein F4776DRAFT_667056 [Hypoxylon sp. NC0597]|nr:hypothetical protein F4776DRAFT_667056 [Hypoxylon sp. NC0597]